MLLSLLLLWGPASAGGRVFFEDWPINDAIPHLKTVEGFDFGERVALHREVIAYAKVLANASPRVSYQAHGSTWEGREMGLLFISSEKNINQLNQLQKKYQQLADPRITDAARLAELKTQLPVCVWLNESVHGNETSGTDSGILLAYYLAAGTAPSLAQMLDKVLVVVELCQNPDGRDRFVTYSRGVQSPGGNPDPFAAEHAEPWPSGRPNHYLFDMNRDWFAMTQVETQAKVAAYLQWYPQVSIDLHEMGEESTFFAATPSPPANPLLPRSMLDQYEAFGKAVGQRFDKQGWRYFHSEVFDSFYPGYGESWPSLQGTVGMLFEQASVGGLQYKKRDGEVVYHWQGVQHQAHASFAVIELAAKNREELLQFFYAYREEAILQGKEADYRNLVLNRTDSGREEKLVNLLMAQGIEVEQISEGFKGVPGTVYPSLERGKADVSPGSFLIRFSQPSGKLAQSLLLPELAMDEAFLAHQEKRHTKRYPSEIYDVTGWSLPLAYGTEGLLVQGSFKPRTEPLALNRSSIPTSIPELGYFAPRSDRVYRLVCEFLTRGGKLYTCFKSTEVANRILPPSAFYFPREGLDGANLDWLLKTAAQEGVDLLPADAGWLGPGNGLGAGHVVYLQPPKIAMLWDEPTSSLSAGWMRYTLEQVFRYPVTPVKVKDFDDLPLNRYQVLIVPDGRYSGKKLDGESIKRWVQDGGVLVTIAGGTDWALTEGVGLLASAREMAGGELEREDLKREPVKIENDPIGMVQPLQEEPRAIPGSLVRANLDANHWLAMGSAPEVAVMVESDRVLRPVRLNQGRTIGRYAPSEKLVLSGVVPETSKNQLANKAFLMVQDHGRGRVVAFAEDPNYRGFLLGLRPLVFNAILLGPSSLYAE